MKKTGCMNIIALQVRRNGFGIWGGGGCTTLTYKKDAILCISISDFQNPLSYEPILALLLYTDLYVAIFILLFFFGGGGVAKYFKHHNS